MKLACISTILGYPWGSPDRLWTDLASRAQARGDEVFLGLSALTADHANVRKLCANGAELFVRTSNSVYRGSRDALMRRLPWRRDHYLETRLDAFAPDLVLITQGATYDSLAEQHLVAWLHRKKIPYIVVCHNNAGGTSPSPQELGRLRGFFDRSARILFVSTHNLQQAAQHLGKAPSRSSLIQNPLSTTIAAGLPTVPLGPVPLVGVVGRIDIAHKGLDLLFEAVASLPPGSLRIALTGRVENPASLSALITRHHLQDIVEVRGPLEPNAVMQAYGELELFLLPSRYEGCASSMIEAMMCGRPVLATEVGGVSDWITDGVEGFLATEISATSIHKTLVRALAQRPSWPVMGVAARARFDRQRDPDPVGTLMELVDASAQAEIHA